MAAPIPPAQLKYYEEHASDNQQPNLIATIVLCLVLPCIAVFLRFLARWINNAAYKADDWLILSALVRKNSESQLVQFLWLLISTQLPLAGMSTTTGLGVRYGEGKHIIFIKNPRGFVQVSTSDSKSSTW